MELVEIFPENMLATSKEGSVQILVY